jgi:hypothetical protein
MREMFILFKNIQIGSGAPPASYSMGTCVLSRGEKRLGLEVKY